MSPTIGIVGGGPSGISSAIHLLNNLTNVKIILFDDVKNFGKGIAFNTISDILLLNTSVECTSIFYDDRMHFFNWLKVNNTLCSSNFYKNSFVPRRIASEYLLDNLKYHVKKGKKKNIIFQHQHSYLKSYVEKNIFKDSKGKLFDLDYLILCTGHTKIKHGNQPFLSNEIAENQNIIHLPYINNDINKLKKTDRIIILGSKLSAIDTILLLEKNSHEGEIFLISKSGQLPAVRNSMNTDYEPVFLSLKKIQSILNDKKRKISTSLIKAMFIKELRILYGTNQPLNDIFELHKNPYLQLDEDIKNCTDGFNKWELIISNLLDILTYYWSNFSRSEKNFVKKKYKQFISRNISAMPLKNALTIKSFFEKGQLKIINSITQIEYNGNSYCITSDNTLEHFDRVINATGAYVENPNTDTLYKSLSTAKMIKSNTDIPIQINNKFESTSRQNQYARIYAIGPSVSDNTIIDNYFLESSRQAEIVSKNISIDIEKNTTKI